MALRRLRGSRAKVFAASTLALAAAVSASGLAADASSAATPQAVHAHLAYRCRFPFGTQPVSATAVAKFPSAVVAGQPITVSGLHLSVAFPRSVAAYLHKRGIKAVSGRDVLAATVAAKKAKTTTLWPGRTPSPAVVPGATVLHLTFSGPVPPVTASTPGTVTFTAAGLTLALIARANTVAGNAPALLGTCTPAPGKNARLATVPVTPAPARPGHSGARRHAKSPATAHGGVPKGCAKRLIHGGTASPVLGCAHLLGYADVRKLEGAALVGPAADSATPAAFLHVDTYASDIGCVPPEPTIAACTAHNGVIHVYSCTAAQLDYRKQLEFPPTKATFLTFGFVPVTAVMELAETTWPASHPPTENKKCYRGFNQNEPVKLKSPIITVFSDLSDSATEKFPVLNISETYLTIHIVQLEVNGVPLNPGADCGTAQPVQAVLIGHGHNGPPPTGYTLDKGGPLSGNVTIPQFAHCGVGENLNPLFDGSISGPGNFQLMTQGTLCTPQQSGKPGCPPTVPKPLRHVKS